MNINVNFDLDEEIDRKVFIKFLEALAEAKIKRLTK